MKKTLIGASIALNVVVLIACLGLWIGGPYLAGKYLMEPRQARWVSQFEMLPVQAGDIVVLGDSITEGGIWEELFPELPVRNRGIGGDTTAGVLQRLRQVSEGKPSRVFLLIGTNDLSGGVPLDTIAANIAEIVEGIGEESPETRVFVQSVLPRGASYRKDVEQLNAKIKTLITGRAHWIDLYPLFLDGADGSIRDELSNDELHLTGEGYLLWRDAIAEQLTDQPE